MTKVSHDRIVLPHRAAASSAAFRTNSVRSSESDPKPPNAKYRFSPPRSSLMRAPASRLPVARPSATSLLVDISSRMELDRKSTRLNSSHSQISYAVFCLKKKKKTNNLASCHLQNKPPR